MRASIDRSRGRVRTIAAGDVIQYNNTNDRKRKAAISVTPISGRRLLELVGASLCALAAAVLLLVPRAAVDPARGAPALDGCSWSRAGEIPLAVYDAAGAVDPVAAALYVHGGVDRDNVVRDELYRLDLRADQPPVTRIPTTGAAVPRWGHSLTWVLERGRARLYAIGGATARGDDVPADGRVFGLDPDGSRWQVVPVTGGSLGVLDHAAAYDPVHNVIVVHGGRLGTGRDDVSQPRDETYFLDVDTGRVTLGPRGGPKLYSHSMVFDPAGLRMLVFGGTPDGQRGVNAVGVLDLANGPGLAQWSTLTVGGAAPGPRFNHGAALDPDRRAMIVYGGLKGLDESLMDTWALDLSQPGAPTWQDLSLANGRRSGMVMHHNPLLGLTLQVSGGRPLSPEASRDVFSLRCAAVGPTRPPPGTVVLPPTQPGGTVVLPTERTPTPTGTAGPGTVVPPPPPTATAAGGTPATPAGTATATPTPGPGTVLPPPATVPASPSAGATPHTGTPAASGTPTPPPTVGTPPATPPAPGGTPPTATATGGSPSTPGATATAGVTATAGSTEPSTPPVSPSATTTPSPRPVDGRTLWLPYNGLARPRATPTPTRAATPSATPDAVPASPTPSPTARATTPPPATASPVPCIVAEHEPNDTLLEALDRPPLCADRPATGSIPAGDASDHWRLEAPRPGLVQADLAGIPSGTNFDLYLYTRQGQLLAVSQRPGTEAEHVEARVSAAGDYYVRVYASEGRSPAPYEIRWSMAP